jgi:predicted DNA-binding transcriptional regulator AlpA
MVMQCEETLIFLRCAMEKRMMDIKELGAYIGLRPQTIRNQISLGRFQIPTKKIGRLLKWDRKDVDQYLDRLRRIN